MREKRGFLIKGEKNNLVLLDRRTREKSKRGLSSMLGESLIGGVNVVTDNAVIFPYLAVRAFSSIRKYG